MHGQNRANDTLCKMATNKICFVVTCSIHHPVKAMNQFIYQFISCSHSYQNHHEKILFENGCIMHNDAIESLSKNVILGCTNKIGVGISGSTSPASKKTEEVNINISEKSWQYSLMN